MDTSKEFAMSETQITIGQGPGLRDLYGRRGRYDHIYEVVDEVELGTWVEIVPGDNEIASNIQRSLGYHAYQNGYKITTMIENGRLYVKKTAYLELFK